MAIFKCKICGGSLEITNAQSVATCEYCGTKQTLPKLDDERKENLYNRATHFRRNNDFDKAMGIYENILNEDNTDAESYWSIVLCRYGIEYVEDPATHKRVPTVNRAQFTSIFDDEDYKSALANADQYQREIYEAEATVINEIQKGILAISQKEEPFDVFVCYKETDAAGRRTQDSVLATELYHELTREGFKVFFSRITLEDKLGVAYEPYIFAALHSAKVMVVLGTRPENFNAVWVKNEWSRYLALIKNGAKKTLIPAYRDMDPYDLPDEFSHLQAQDMSRLGFMQDLVRGIKKLVPQKPPIKAGQETVVLSGSAGIEPLFKRASMALEDGEFERADAFYEQILNQDPENAEAYVGKLLVDLRIKSKSALRSCADSFENNNHYKKAIQFANADLKNELCAALETVLFRIDNKKKEEIYQEATALLNRAKDIPTCKNAQKLFISISNYYDAAQCVASCQDKIDDFQKEWDLLRLEKQKKIEEHRRAVKKAKKRAWIISLCVLLMAILSFVAYVAIAHVVIPNSQYKDALVMAEEQKYDEAISLLKTAKEKARSDKTISKIDQAIDDTKSAKKAKREAEEAKKVREEAVASGISDMEKNNYERAIRSLLRAGVPTQIVYQCEGGMLVDEQILDVNEILYTSSTDFPQMPHAERTGYRFVEWSCEKSEYQEAENRFLLVLKATWSEKEYVIRYRLDGGTASNPVEYGVEDDAITLTAPQKTGYTFIGWTGTGLETPSMTVTIPSGSHGDRIYTANWQANTYSVTFDPAGGSMDVSEATYAYNQSVTLPTPERDAYTFAGWYHGTQKVSNGTWKFASDVTLVAKWTPITYHVTYMVGSVPASNPNKTQFTVESNTIPLSNLSYDYCMFEGWYSDSNFTNKVTEIPKGTWKNITLYAKWDIQSFTIEYDWNGGNEVTSAKKTYTVLDLPLYLPSPSKSDHEFLYWTDTDRNGDLITEIKTCKDYSLYANYLIEGMSFSNISGAGYTGFRCIVNYTGEATSIEIPKYYLDEHTYVEATYRVVEVIGSIQSCPNLETVIMSDGVLIVNNYAFEDCPKLKNVILSENLGQIKSYAFLRCPSLQTLSIPDSLMAISSLSFSGCENLEFNQYEGVNYLGNAKNPYMVLFGVTDITVTTITLHPDTRIIADDAFDGCTSLTDISIPGSVVHIGKRAFSDCSSLTSVVFENPNSWWVSNDCDMEDMTEIKGLSNTSTAATYLIWSDRKTNYSLKYWMRFETT